MKERKSTWVKFVSKRTSDASQCLDFDFLHQPSYKQQQLRISMRGSAIIRLLVMERQCSVRSCYFSQAAVGEQQKFMRDPY
jgi:hypothetical protein